MLGFRVKIQGIVLTIKKESRKCPQYAPFSALSMNRPAQSALCPTAPVASRAPTGGIRKNWPFRVTMVGGGILYTLTCKGIYRAPCGDDIYSL